MVPLLQELWTDPKAREVKGPLFSVHKYTEMPGQEADYMDVRTRKVKSTHSSQCITNCCQPLC